MLLIFLGFILVGALVGVLAGLFGFGGGILIVPAIAMFIKTYQPEYASNSMQIAVATSLFTMIFISIKAALSHHKAKNIIWDTSLKLMAGLIVGTIFGSIIASYFSSDILHALFVLFLIYTISKLLRKLLEKPKSQQPNQHHLRQEISTKLLCIYGFITGSISVLLGLGGSIIIVPFLRNRNYTLTQSAAIATTITPFLALIGTISYIVVGSSGDLSTPKYCLGYVYLPVAISIIIGSFAGATIGVKLSGRLPQKVQNWAYLVIVCLILLLMVVYT